MEVIVTIGFYTIWFTPIIFVVNLIGAMKAVKEGRETTVHTGACAISLLLIVIPIFFSMF